MSSDRFENSENESLDVEDAGIRSLLGGLKRVGAPAGFDARIKARIADGKPGGFGFPLALRYAVPLVLLLAVGGYFVFDRFYDKGRESAPQVATKGAETPAVNSNESVIETTSSVPNDTLAHNPPPAANGSSKNPKPDRPQDDMARSSTRSVRSMDSTANQIKPIFPPGIGNSGNTSEKPNTQETTVKLSIQEFLKIIGATADFQDAGWTVRSVGENTASQRSGLKAGDVILAVGDRTLTKTTEFEGGFEAKSVKVRRGTATIHVQLK